MKHYKITRTVEPDGTWIRLYEDGRWIFRWNENDDGYECAMAKLKSLKEPPKEEVLYEEGKP